MKSIASILFSVFYLAISVGMSVNVHLCTNNMASSEITDCSDNGCCGNGETQSCCTELTCFVQLDNAERICLNVQDAQDLIPSQNTGSISFINPLVVKEGTLYPIELPGSNRTTPLYTLYCSHLHYG